MNTDMSAQIEDGRPRLEHGFEPEQYWVVVREDRRQSIQEHVGARELRQIETQPFRPRSRAHSLRERLVHAPVASEAIAGEHLLVFTPLQRAHWRKGCNSLQKRPN